MAKKKNIKNRTQDISTQEKKWTTSKKLQTPESSERKKSYHTGSSADRKKYQSGKKIRINENNLTKILALTVIVVGIVIIVGYLYYFSTLKPLTDRSESNPEKNANEMVMPIQPYKAYSIKKEDLIANFGPGTPGEGVSQDTKYVDYDQHWFDLDVNARYYYGLENRVYETILSYDEDQDQILYTNMRKVLGTPLSDNFLEEKAKKKETFWIKDSVNVFLRRVNVKPEVEMHLAYYDNSNKFDLGDRPTIIQRINTDVTGDGNPDGVLLIGTKTEYTTPVYKNLFLLVGNKEGAFYTVFPKETDGGTDPQLEMVDLDGDGKKDFLVTADQDYVKNYNGFKIEGKKIIGIYSSDMDPLEKKE